MVRRIVKIVAFFVIGIMLLFAVQGIFAPKWYSDGATNRVLSGFFALENDTAEVLFLGTSHMGRGVSPMKIYEDTGIVSYNLATSGQPLECSYFLLKEAFKTQSPKVVFLDAGRILNGEGNNNNSYWRYIIDNFPRDEVFWELVEAYSELPDSDGSLAAWFPLIKYHSRWDQLTEESFESRFTGGYYSAGQYIMSYSSPCAPSQQVFDEKVAQISEESVITIRAAEEGVLSAKAVKKDGYAPELTGHCMEYVLKIKSLCEENGAELVIVKIPSYTYSGLNMSDSNAGDYSWNILKSDLLRAFTDENDIRFIDMMYDVNIVDSLFDTHDSGHLNVNGAEKVSAFIEKILRQYHISPNTNEKYDENLEKYRLVSTVAKLQSERDFHQYLETLSENAANWLILISACDEYTYSLDSQDFDSMEKLGLHLVQGGNFRDAYVAVINSGNVLYEAVSEGPISYETVLCNQKIKLYSGGGNNFSTCNILLEGKDYSNGCRGLNFVVIDKETNLVIDAASFDTFSESKTFTRAVNETNTRLRAYESAICFQ